MTDVQPPFVAVIEWQVQLSWFELDYHTRRDYTRQVREILKRYPQIRFRWFDAEAWTGKFTDFSLVEFDDLDAYNSLWGELRRHPFLSTPFALPSRVVMGRHLTMPAEPEETPPPAPTSEPVAAAAPPLCGHCGQPVKPTARFCGSCGQANPLGAGIGSDRAAGRSGE